MSAMEKPTSSPTANGYFVTEFKECLEEMVTNDHNVEQLFLEAQGELNNCFTIIILNKAEGA